MIFIIMKTIHLNTSLYGFEGYKQMRHINQLGTVIVLVLVLVTTLINPFSVGAIASVAEGNSSSDVIVDTYWLGNVHCIVLNSSKFEQRGHVFIYHKYTEGYTGYFSQLSWLLNGSSIIYQESGGNITMHKDYAIFQPGVDNTTISAILSSLLNIGEDEIRNVRLYYYEGTDSGILVAFTVGAECASYQVDSNDIVWRINEYLEITVDKLVIVDLLESYDIAKHDASRIYEVLGDSNPYVRAIGYYSEAELPVVVVEGDIPNSALDELVDTMNNIAVGYVLVIVDHDPVAVEPLPLRENSLLMLGAVFVLAIILAGAFYYWKR